MNKTLVKKLNYIYENCSKLLNLIIGENFNVAGNIAIFPQSEEEYSELSKLAKQLTKPSDNPNQKYFELINPINIDKATFTHLYIRKYDDSEYGKNLGDVDFVASSEIYSQLKSKVIEGELPGTSMYDRPGWDTIQMAAPDINVVAYLSTQQMAEKARVKFDNLTNL